MLKNSSFMALLLVAGLAFTAQAQTTAPAAKAAAKPATTSQQPLTAELSQFLVVVENGKEVLKPVGTVKPGDLIEYRVVYTNRTQAPLSDVVADLPLPEGLEYQPKTTRPAASALAAVKGGAFGREPLTRPGANGQPEPVPYSEYRQLRWPLGQIAAGAKAQVSARARVSSGVPASSQSGVQSAAPVVAGR
jgi:uncharacterized repeat protein (TIGR01451 family)